MKDLVKVENAIISVYDKEGAEEFVEELVKVCPGITIMSSGGTYNAIKTAAGKNLMEVSDYTRFPEMPGGLVKTLHPKIHAGILAEGTEDHNAYLEYHKIREFQLIITNLYPFTDVVTRKPTIEEARKNIDIGGVTLTYAGSKNFLKVAVITDISDYGKLIEELKRNKGRTSAQFRQEMSKKALKKISSYLEAISSYFSKIQYFDLKEEYKNEGL